jgi:hypothetical protein
VAPAVNGPYEVRILCFATSFPPWLFISERQAQLTRQAVNYIIRLAGEMAKLGRRTCCDTIAVGVCRGGIRRSVGPLMSLTIP